MPQSSPFLRASFPLRPCSPTQPVSSRFNDPIVKVGHFEEGETRFVARTTTSVGGKEIFEVIERLPEGKARLRRLGDKNGPGFECVIHVL